MTTKQELIPGRQFRRILLQENAINTAIPASLIQPPRVDILVIPETPGDDLELRN